MNPKRQLIILTVLSGAFGWIWIGGGIAILLFAGLAWFVDWSWWNLLYAAIVSGVAKWLARGFLDNLKRVAFEAEMVSKGMSPKEAGQAWSEAYFGHGTPASANVQPSDTSNVETNRQAAEERTRIIADYGAFLERNPQAANPTQIWDTKNLPYSKERILDSICLELVKENDQKRVNALEVVAISLASYQDGVGDLPLGFDLSEADLKAAIEDGVDALAARIIAANPDPARFEKYSALHKKDLTNIMARLYGAKKIGQEMPEEKKTEVLG